MNAGFSYREEVARDLASLVDHLARRYPHASADDWARSLARGELEVDGQRVRGDVALHAGQRVVWHRPPWEEPEAPLRLGVVHEDASLLVVDKPAGLPTLPGGGFLEHTLLALVRARDPRWSPVHRLGRGTTGLVVCCRDASAGARLQAAFVGREVDKRYLALVRGALGAPRVIDVPIGPVPHAKLGRVHAACPEGKASQTLVVGAWPRGSDTLVELRLVTGRPHQLRIHLAAIGHPLVGDPLYVAGGVPGGEALPGEGGFRLHAWRIAFPHPTDGRPMAFEAPIPAALA
ncbi:MAG TPA: RluA family pseudouridine synthase [Myxococcales bacterium]|nr:RluA family pseudouridine synthase [Myxococcales bacterium]